MVPARRTLAIVAITTTLVGCSSQTVPATTSTMTSPSPRIYATTATSPLLNDLAFGYSDKYQDVQFQTDERNYIVLLDEMVRGEVPYMLTNHLPIDSPLWAAPVAQDALVIVTHPQIPVDSLSLAQIRSIYQGRITNWQVITGEDQDIELLIREDGSGTREEFSRMVMGYRPVNRNGRVVSSSRQMVSSVATVPGSIGFVSLGYLNSQVDHPVAIIPIDGVVPSIDTVVNGAYPLRSIIYLAGLSEPEDAYRAFFGWIQQPDGQHVVAEHYVPFIATPGEPGVH